MALTYYGKKLRGLITDQRETRKAMPALGGYHRHCCSIPERENTTAEESEAKNWPSLQEIPSAGDSFCRIPVCKSQLTLCGSQHWTGAGGPAESPEEFSSFPTCKSTCELQCLLIYMRLLWSLSSRLPDALPLLPAARGAQRDPSIAHGKRCGWANEATRSRTRVTPSRAVIR